MEEVISMSMLEESNLNEDNIMKKIRSRSGKIFKIVNFSNRDSQKEQNQEIMNVSFIVYNRKEKSLEELCRRFMACLIDFDEKIVCLDAITNQLGVERRRIYDIINILESLKLVKRKCKNQYMWRGFLTIYNTIQEKREKSLEVLSTGFIKLFMQQKRVWTLEEAAKFLSNFPHDENRLKTKIRRLYDIANVLKSIGLIKKTHLETRKPAFEWVGTSGLESFQKQMKKKDKENQEVRSYLGLDQFYETIMDKMIKSQINTEKKQGVPITFQPHPFTPRIRKTFTIIQPPCQGSTPRKTLPRFEE